MPTKRYGTSSVSTISPEVLVVTGGKGSDFKMLDIVEVLMTGQWITIDPLHTPAIDMVSTVHEGNLYEILYCHGDGGVYRGTISGEICTLMQLVNMFVYIDSLRLCMYCVFDMHVLYMCRYACACIVKYAFSMYVLCIQVCICIFTLKCMYTCSMIMHV